jgi:hypothetical protein
MTTRAIDALLDIMLNEEISTRRRIEAAEGLLAYEAPPEVVEQAKAFLESVFEDDEQSVQDRLDAVKLARKFEAAKVTPRTVHTKRDETDRREKWRRYEIAQRHWKLSLAIMDTPPPGWADDLYSDSYVAPDLPPAGLPRNRLDSRRQNQKHSRMRRLASISLASRRWIRRIPSVLENGLLVSGASAVIDPCAIQIVSERPALRRAPPDQSTMM